MNIEDVVRKEGEPVNTKGTFRVYVDNKNHTYKLIQEDITLTEEQAMQIASAYYGHSLEATHSSLHDNKNDNKL